jgi:hypothetical protein
MPAAVCGEGLSRRRRPASEAPGRAEGVACAPHHAREMNDVRVRGVSILGALMPCRGMSRLTTIPALLIGLGILAITAGLLYAAGRSPICPCGTVKLFDFVPKAAEDSQHIFDWYTFSHILHGLIFYFFIWLIGRGRVPFLVGILIALVLESGWELFENSQYIINRYQSQSISEHYNGDSILNAIGDILTMAAGFFLASLLPVLASIALLIGIEVWMAWMIRDNLTLNIISLTHPIPAITEWQEGRK